MSADPTRTNDHVPVTQTTISVKVANAEAATVTTAVQPTGEREHSGTIPTAASTVSVPGYEIQGELGRGGMGVVYKARQMALNRTVALKMVLSGEEGHKELIRFLAEAEAVAAVKHPNVVQVHDFGEANGKPFMALEYLSGGNLAERFYASAGREDSTAVAGLVSRIARGVAAAHEQGIVHRDLKPGNVLLDEIGNPKVTDFGLAKRGGGSNLTETKAIMGTPAYMSPEQASGGTKFVGPPADVWALGVILYEGLTGIRPFSGDGVQGLLSHILTGEPISPRKRVATVPGDLELICLKCLLKQPQERYPTAKELADDLERFIRGEQISVRSAGPLERGVKWAKRNKLVAGALAMGVLALVVGSAVSVAFGVEAREQASRANEEASRASGEARRADQERNAAVDARNDLKRASVKLEQANTELNDALARALIAPISPKNTTISLAELTPYEVEAFWELATRQGTPVNRRFLEEATRLPLSSKQVGGRAEFSIHAAIGLNPELREQTEQLFLSRGRAPNITQEHRLSLILAWAMDESASPAGAAELANFLLVELDNTTEGFLAIERSRTLLQLAKRMEPQAAAKVCGAGTKSITEQLSKTTDPIHLLKFAKLIAVVGQALQPSAAAVECKSVAGALVTLMSGATKWDDVYELTDMLASLAGRMEPTTAAAVCDAAATPLVESLRNTQQHESLLAISRGLASLIPYLKPTRVAQIRSEVTVILSGQMRRTNEWEPLVVLAYAIHLVAERGGIPEKDRIAKSVIEAMTAASKAPEIKPHTFKNLALGLVMICDEMELATAQALCETASTLLIEVIARDPNPNNFGVLAETLTLLTGQLDPKAAAEVHGRAAAFIVARVVDPATNPGIAELRLSLGSLAGRLERV